MKEKKYELTENKKEYNGRILYQIRALKDFSDVKAGDLGGWIEKESNLSQYGNCWIFDNAMACDNAIVYNDAEISGNAKVCHNAIIHGNVKVCNNATVYHNAKVFGNAEVSGNAKVSGNAEISGNTVISCNVEIYNDATVQGNAKVYGNAEIFDYARISGNAMISGDVEISGNAEISGDIGIFGKVRIFDALYNDSYISVGPIGSSKNYTTAFLNKDKHIMVTTGCFKGTIEKFKNRVKETHGNNKYGKQYNHFIKYIEEYFKDILEGDDKE